MVTAAWTAALTAARSNMKCRKGISPFTKCLCGNEKNLHFSYLITILYL